MTRRLIMIREGSRPLVRSFGPLRRLRLQCAECGFAWLRPGACVYRMVFQRWSGTMRWTCKNKKDCWRRQRHKVAG